jgi:2-succinyl-5-enolpyruvyl-6-hydroxy-3-cyclohexene-1-carboxylate synthase
MILVGVLPPNSISAHLLQQLASDNSVLVFTETTSNLHHPEFFAGIDKIIAPLNEEGFHELKPEILLTFGNMVVSKKIKSFLRKYTPQQHWHISQTRANNTFHILNRHIHMPLEGFLEEFLRGVKPNQTSGYKPYWLKIQAHRNVKHSEYMEQIVFSDFKVFYHLFAHLNTGENLHFGNSSPIRYAQLFELHPSLKVYCNRGTSGIEGSTSTAIGSALKSGSKTILVTGDLSFLYDSNALWNNYIPKDFKILLINNQGGGIFRILPGNKNTENFDTFFETCHTLDASHLAPMHQFEYYKASSEEELVNALPLFISNDERPGILEVFTPRLLNDEILLQYFEYIR